MRISFVPWLFLISLISLVALPAAVSASEAAATDEEAMSARLLLSLQAPEAEGEEEEEEDTKPPHRFFRLGFRVYGTVMPDHEYLSVRSGVAMAVPLSFDFFYGIGVRVAFRGAYNRGDLALDWIEPAIPRGQDGWTTSPPSESGERVDVSVRGAHLAMYAITFGFNYEVTARLLRFFRVFQPFAGAGVVISWIMHYPDLTVEDSPLFNNEQNDLTNPNNVDPWSSQSTAGWEVYGGFHINFPGSGRFTTEIGYTQIEVPEALLDKATEGYEARHLAYVRREIRIGGGFEWRF